MNKYTYNLHTGLTVAWNDASTPDIGDIIDLSSLRFARVDGRHFTGTDHVYFVVTPLNHIKCYADLWEHVRREARERN